jgi:hypothetical protein
VIDGARSPLLSHRGQICVESVMRVFPEIASAPRVVAITFASGLTERVLPHQACVPRGERSAISSSILRMHSSSHAVML